MTKTDFISCSNAKDSAIVFKIPRKLYIFFSIIFLYKYNELILNLFGRRLPFAIYLVFIRVYIFSNFPLELTL